MAVLLTALLAAQRSVSVEHAGRAADALLLSGTSPARIFAGKALALAAQLAVLEVLLGLAMLVLYDARIEHFGLAVAAAAAATVGIAAAGTLYGVLAAPHGSPRDPASGPAPAGLRTGSHRRHAGLRRRPGHHRGERLGVVRPAGSSSPWSMAVFGALAYGPPAGGGGVMAATPVPAAAMRGAP